VTDGGDVSGPGGYAVLDLGGVEDVPAAGIHSRTVHADGDLRMVLFGFAAGEELSEHTASRAAIIHVLSGAFDLTLGGEPVDAPAGTVVHMAAGLPHALRATTPSRMLLTLIPVTAPEVEG
jgi:quercetin dioxygenase-like cupin family protein